MASLKLEKKKKRTPNCWKYDKSRERTYRDCERKVTALLWRCKKAPHFSLRWLKTRQWATPAARQNVQTCAFLSTLPTQSPLLGLWLTSSPLPWSQKHCYTLQWNSSDATYNCRDTLRGWTCEGLLSGPFPRNAFVTFPTVEWTLDAHTVQVWTGSKPSVWWFGMEWDKFWEGSKENLRASNWTVFSLECRISGSTPTLSVCISNKPPGHACTAGSCTTLRIAST